ncbi:MAG: GIY-YIG catalytic domain protein [bacterium ADurb.Bin429]|nr:MAG: GIY-YIG catalytic domain protein [bacterium ADurb.Bin429]
MKYVYLLQRIRFTRQHYIGITRNLRDRLKQHNAGKSPHTAKYRPWKLIVALYFDDDEQAMTFKRYLQNRLWFRVSQTSLLVRA